MVEEEKVAPEVSARPQDDEVCSTFDASFYFLKVIVPCHQRYNSELKDDENDSGWRNSYAPNEGYQNFGEGNYKKQKSVDYERRRSSLRRNSSILTEEDFKKQAYGMLRKQKNPNPNFCDKVGFAIYIILRVYIPVSAIVSSRDFRVQELKSLNLRPRQIK